MSKVNWIKAGILAAVLGLAVANIWWPIAGSALMLVTLLSAGGLWSRLAVADRRMAEMTSVLDTVLEVVKANSETHTASAATLHAASVKAPARATPPLKEEK